MLQNLKTIFNRVFAFRKTKNVGLDYMSELDKIPVDEWPKIWCELNVWKIPKKMAHIKPQWFDGGSIYDKSIFINPLMKKIEMIVGHKACNREWNRDRMTDAQHEAFWKGWEDRKKKLSNK